MKNKVVNAPIKFENIAILAKGRFRTDVLWNALPVAIRRIDQLPLFSKKVNQFYISKFNLRIIFIVF